MPKRIYPCPCTLTNPRYAIPNRWTSGVRHRFRDAFRSSIPYITKETVFTITRYKISNSNGCLFLICLQRYIFLISPICRPEDSPYLCHMAERNELHKRNRHNGQYDFSRLTEEYPPLKKFIVLNAYGTTSIDFFNPGQ